MYMRILYILIGIIIVLVLSSFVLFVGTPILLLPPNAIDNDVRLRRRRLRPQQQKLLLHVNVTNDVLEQELLDAIQGGKNGTWSIAEDDKKKSISPLDDCPVTRQVKIYNETSNIAAAANYWILETYDKYGNIKTVGGDEYYITIAMKGNGNREASTSSASSTFTRIYPKYYSVDEMDDGYGSTTASTSNEPDGVAYIQDYGNGTYKLEFVEPPPLIFKNNNNAPQMQQRQLLEQTTTSINDNGTTSTAIGEGGESIIVITIYMQYTCNIGRMAYPSKRNWANGGAILSKTTKEMIRTSLPPSFIRKFEPPNNGPTMTGGDAIDLSQYDYVAFVGDSVIMQLAGQHVLHQPNVKYIGYQGILNTNRVSKILFAVRSDRNSHQLQNHTLKTAIVTGSGVWDLIQQNDETRRTQHDPIQTQSFEDHLQACRLYIQKLQELYPNTSIYWKSITAMHPHRIHKSECYNDTNNNNHGGSRNSCARITKYMSTSRSYYLHQQQRQLMSKLHIPYLNLYDATYLSAHITGPEDGRHYCKELMYLMNTWYFNSTISQQQQHQKIVNLISKEYTSCHWFHRRRKKNQKK